jgi:hypothetical protein
MLCSEKRLKELATKFRKALLACNKNSLFITLRTFPNGSCGDAAYLLARYLLHKGCGQFDYVNGIRQIDLRSHAWLEQDGIIVDITSDQFKGNSAEVLVTSDRTWHQQFEEDDRHTADFELYNEHLKLSLQASYNQILNQLET